MLFQVLYIIGSEQDSVGGGILANAGASPFIQLPVVALERVRCSVVDGLEQPVGDFGVALVGLEDELQFVALVGFVLLPWFVVMKIKNAMLHYVYIP